MGSAVYATPWPLYPRERDAVPIVQKGGWTPGPVWTASENPPSPGFDSRTVQLVASTQMYDYLHGGIRGSSVVRWSEMRETKRWMGSLKGRRHVGELDFLRSVTGNLTLRVQDMYDKCVCMQLAHDGSSGRDCAS